MDDLTLVAHNIFLYSEQSAEDMRDQMQNRFALLNQKADSELKDLQEKAKQNIEATKKRTVEVLQSEIKDSVDQLRIKTEIKVQTGNRDIIKKMETKVDKVVKDEVKKSFFIQDLIGDFQPYSTFANFTSTFHRKTLRDFDSIKS